MGLPDQVPPSDNGEYALHSPDLDEMEFEEIAMDWIKQVLRLPINAVDLNPRVATDQGIMAAWKIRRDFEAETSEETSALLLFDPGPEPLTSEKAERTSKQSELVARIRTVIDHDPGVVAKNRFLGLLADMIDGEHALEQLTDEFEDVAFSQGHTLAEDERNELRNTIKPLAGFEAGSVISLLVSLRLHTESRHDPLFNKALLYADQFLGLWAIYKAGQEETNLSSATS
jgi:hypothetical protein